MPSGLIIVVDDNATFRKMYSDFLSLHGYTVMTASSGAEGMKILLNCTPMVLILDISMPEMDGIETCRQIRQIHGNDIPIMFLTAFNDVDKLRDCLHAGGDDYLIKSGDLDNVLERVKFWSTAANRQEARIRRADVIQDVENTVERIDQATEEADNAASFIEKLSRMMAAAQTLADDAGLKGDDSNDYIVGYAAGIVSHWADTQAAVKLRYMSYLQAALTASSMFSSEKIVEVMDNFYQISAEPLFMTARKRARADCLMIPDGGDIAEEDDEARVAI
jgi:DNA-binding response OmpR family regulator